MAPLGLVISKLGVQATATNELVTGLICLKVSIPRDGDTKQSARYGLFSSKPPKLTSPPTLHSLPLTPSSISHRHQHIATSLLNLGTSYPPSPAYNTGGIQPYLDVSSTTGQIYLVLDSTPVKRSFNGAHASRAKHQGKSGRREWVVVMEFEMGIERCIDGSLKTSLPIPKCLDNVLRFQILSPHASSSSTPDGDVSIITEPKLLTLPHSTFISPGKGADRRDGFRPTVRDDDGWEDGEDLGPDDRIGDDDEGGGEEDEEGSWLEGRFQSSDVLRLEWSIGGQRSPSSSLQVTPHWDRRQPSIHVQYESVTSSNGSTIPVEAVIPDGWGWSNLVVYGDDLLDWRSIDSDAWDVSTASLQSPYSPKEEEAPDDSFSTVRGKRTANPLTHSRSSPTPHYTSSVSLLRQTLPGPLDMKMEDFSFEMNSMDNLPPARPITPNTKHSPPIASPRPPTQPSRPVAARIFDLHFEGSGDKAWVLQGTLVPLSTLTLVTPSLPSVVPFVRIVDDDLPCHATCLGGLTTSGQKMDSVLCDTSGSSIGAFTWTDDYGNLLPPHPATPVKGEVKILLTRNTWGIITLSVQFSWPRRASEVAFTLRETHPARIIRAVRGGSPIPRAIAKTQKGTEIRLGTGGKEGLVEIVLDVEGNEDIIALPRFEGDGNLRVELQGRGWDSVESDMTLVKPGVWTHNLSSPSTLRFQSDSMSTSQRNRNERWKTLFSWNTFFNLFILWSLVSMAQQVQRLRNEVAFVAEEARDLRLYGVGTTVTTTLSSTSTPTAATLPQEVNGYPAFTDVPRKGGQDVMRTDEKTNGISTSLGRVVFGRSAWEKWVHHPTVRTLSKSLGWVWHAVVWLVAPG